MAFADASEVQPTGGEPITYTVKFYIFLLFFCKLFCIYILK